MFLNYWVGIYVVERKFTITENVSSSTVLVALLHTLSVSSRRSKASTMPWFFMICLALSLIGFALVSTFFVLTYSIRFVFVDVEGEVPRMIKFFTSLIAIERSLAVLLFGQFRVLD